MKTTYAWATRQSNCTYGKYVIYAGITQRQNVGERFNGGYEFRHSDGNIRHGGLVRNKTISVRKSDIVLLETHKLKSYYDQDLMNNFHEQLYINAVRDAGKRLERSGIPVKVGNVSDVIKFFNQWRRSPEACRAGYYTSTKCTEYIIAKECHDKDPDKKGTPFDVSEHYATNGGRCAWLNKDGSPNKSTAFNKSRRKNHWEDTDLKKFTDWCESDNDGHLCDVDVYNSIMEKILGWNKSTNWEMAYRGEKGA